MQSINLALLLAGNVCKATVSTTHIRKGKIHVELSGESLEYVAERWHTQDVWLFSELATTALPPESPTRNGVWLGGRHLAR